jgi:hypothetical protein
MQSDLDELTRVVGTMPRELVREVLAFARFLERKHARAEDPTDWEDDYGQRFGPTGDPLGSFGPIDRWDPDSARDTGARDVA